jgi:recombinational DNA repair protein (RecF pathway)
LLQTSRIASLLVEIQEGVMAKVRGHFATSRELTGDLAELHATEFLLQQEIMMLQLSLAEVTDLLAQLNIPHDEGQ